MRHIVVAWRISDQKIPTGPERIRECAKYRQIGPKRQPCGKDEPEDENKENEQESKEIRASLKKKKVRK